jgi:hypothetical protein
MPARDALHEPAPALDGDRSLADATNATVG